MSETKKPWISRKNSHRCVILSRWRTIYILISLCVPRGLLFLNTAATTAAPVRRYCGSTVVRLPCVECESSSSSFPFILVSRIIRADVARWSNRSRIALVTIALILPSSFCLCRMNAALQNVRRPGSDRPQTAPTAENMHLVGDLVLSQEDRPQTWTWNFSRPTWNFKEFVSL